MKKFSFKSWSPAKSIVKRIIFCLQLIALPACLHATCDEFNRILMERAANKVIVVYTDKSVLALDSAIPEVLAKEDLKNIDRQRIAGIYIPPSIVVINKLCFMSCMSLITVVLSPQSNLKTIESNAFCSCQKLQSIQLENARNLQNIYVGAFCYCNALEKLTVPHGVTEIGAGAFVNCNELESIIIPATVEKMGAAFTDCKKLKTVVFEGNLVKTIPAQTFKGCTSLSSVILPALLGGIADYAFYDCSALVSLKIPESVTAICSFAFTNCVQLANITLPSNLQYIGHRAFTNIRAEFMEIPTSVKRIDPSAFGSDPYLTRGLQKIRLHCNWQGSYEELFWQQREGCEIIKADGTVLRFTADTGWRDDMAPPIRYDIPAFAAPAEDQPNETTTNWSTMKKALVISSVVAILLCPAAFFCWKKGIFSKTVHIA